jgi:hypothetical protein
MPTKTYKRVDGSTGIVEVGPEADMDALNAWIVNDINRPSAQKQAGAMANLAQSHGKRIDVSGKLDVTSEPTLSRINAAVGMAPVQAKQFVQQNTTGGVTPEDIDAQRALGEGAPGMTGNLIGNVLTLGIPGMAAEKGLATAVDKIPQIAANAPRVLKGAVNALRSRTTQAGVVGAGENVLQPTQEGESWKKNAAWGAAGGAGTQRFGRFLSSPVDASKEAKILMEHNIQPTPGQGGTGVTGAGARLLENILSQLPVAGKAAQKAQDRAGNELIEAAAEQAHPGGVLPKANFGRGDYFKEMDPEFEHAYDQIYTPQQQFQIPKTYASRVHAAGAGSLLPDSPELARYNRDMGSILPDFKNTVMDGPQYRETLNRLRAKGRESWNRYKATQRNEDKDLAEAYDAAAEDFHKVAQSRLAPDALAREKDLDSAWAKYEVMKGAAKRNPHPTVDDLVKAVEAAPTGLKLKEQGIFQDLTAPYGKMMENAYGGADPLARKAGYQSSQFLWTNPLALASAFVNLPATSALGTVAGLGMTRGGSKVGLGNTQGQRALAAMLRDYDRLPGYALTPGAAGGAVAATNERKRKK